MIVLAATIQVASTCAASAATVNDAWREMKASLKLDVNLKIHIIWSEVENVLYHVGIPFLQLESVSWPRNHRDSSFVWAKFLFIWFRPNNCNWYVHKSFQVAERPN